MILKLATCALTVAALCSCAGETEPAAPSIDDLSGFVGKWSGTHKLLDDPTEYEASYVVELVGNELVWDFASTYGDGFKGHAVTHWDEVKGKWAESWKDSSDEPESWSYGDWDASTNTMRSSAPGKDWTDPNIDVAIHGTNILGEGEFNYTMTFSYPDGKTTEVMWIHMTSVEG
ncbi:MAG: DUF1579 domain-containing protein [Planctomycetes bacterium]|nr:DUF1579 domain-containing protein [Planctomycetota bacterium]MCP4772037.1 DUF1579 domain-containing protein [Planctomycetota bacterium]MCP4860297.1 DUF1579 domain-containing protein [Planctomycetota bacterium]